MKAEMSKIYLLDHDSTKTVSNEKDRSVRASLDDR